jgi:hypothetical protein
MRATVMRRGDLYVFQNATAIAVVVLDAHVRELDVTLVIRQLVLARPPLDLLGFSFGSTQGSTAAAIRLLKETLVVALELLLQHDTANATAASNQAVDGLLVGAIQANVVRQFPWLRDAGIEGLRRLVVSRAPRMLEHHPTSLGERDEGRPFVTDDIRHDIYQAKLAEMRQIPRVGAMVPGPVPKIDIRNHSKRANRRKCSNLRSP